MFNVEVRCTRHYKKTVEANNRTHAQKKVYKFFIDEIASWDEIREPIVLALHIDEL